MSKYLIRRPNGATDGPFTAAELRTLAYEGQLTDADQISPLGETRWIPARKVGGIREILEMLSPPPAADAPVGPPSEAAGGEPRVSAFTDRPDRDATGGRSATPREFDHEDRGDEPSSRPSSPSSPVSSAAFSRAANPPERSGFADRVLRGAFGFARAISVLVILACSLALVGSLVLAGYSLMPVVPEATDSQVETPALAAFIEECRPVDAGDQARTATDADDDRARQARTRLNPCGPYRADFEFVLRTMQISAGAEDVLCRKVLALPLEYRQQFAVGLRVLAQDYRTRQPSGAQCEPADAVNWYIADFERRVEAELAERRLAELAAAAEAAGRAQRVMLGLSIAGGAGVVLLAFLFLPLLIQIERNTRRILAA